MNSLKTPLAVIVLYLLALNPGYAQKQVVSLNYADQTFGKGQPLPAEDQFSITGAIPPTMRVVELDIIRADNNDFEDPIFHGSWHKSSLSDQGGAFSIPVTTPLRGNKTFDLRFRFYRNTTQAERKGVREKLDGYLRAYVDQNLTIDNNDIDFSRSVDAMMEDLNEVARDALNYYRSSEPVEFSGFSSLVHNKLEQLKSARLKVGERLFSKKKDDPARAKYFRQQISELKDLLVSEVDVELNSGLVVLDEVVKIKEHESEEVPNRIVVHGGYGAVFFNSDEPSDYDSGFNAGITVPFGKRTFAGKFWSRMGFIAGVYFSNFEDEAGREWTGPVIDRPVYAGLGYRAYEFLRLNVGVTAVEPVGLPEDDQLDDIDNGVRGLPFVSLQIDLQLWLDFLQK